MNSICPACGAIYNVTPKDVGRRLRCKKCATGLAVTDAGLELDPAAAPPRPPSSPTAEPYEPDLTEPPLPRRSRNRTGFGLHPAAILDRIGGVSTILFGFGVFLVVFTGFQDAIGRAKIERRQAAIDEGQAEMDAAQRRYDEKKDKKPEDEKNFTQVRENWEKAKRSLEEEKKASEIANRRSTYIDKYYLMFGFLLVAFGCLGYLQTTQAMLLRIVAAVILVSMVLALFKAAVGSGAGIGASMSLG